MRALGASRTSLVPGGALAGGWARDPLWKTARAVPSLDLRFADNKTLGDAYGGGSPVTFTRASSATFVDSSGVLRSAVTNLVLRSEEFDNASWSKVNATVTANSIAAPNGTVTADTITDSNDASAAIHGAISQNQSFTSGLSYTLSVYARAGTQPGIAFVLPAAAFTSNLTAAFNISTGAIVSFDSGMTGSITAVGNGWYRCSVTATATITASSSTTVQIRIATSSTSFYQGNGTGTISIWGAQLEQASTVGDYVPTTSVINSAPRFDHNPTTGESLGLLVEAEAVTNLLLQSNGFNTTWTNTNSSETSLSGTAPDGTNTAWELKDTSDASSVVHALNQLVSFISGTAYTVSCWMKAGVLTEGGLTFPLAAFTSSISARVSLSTGAVITTSAGVTATTQQFPNGWWRVSATATATATTSASMQVRIMNGGVAYIGTGTGTILIWGAQIEAGAFATSYIPTTSATVTRAADVASITGSNFSSWYNQNSGTVYAEYRIPALALGTISSFDDGTANNRWQQRYTATALRHRFVATGSTIDDTDTALVPSISILNKAAYATTVADQRYAGNGTLNNTARTQPAMPVVTQLQLGVGVASDTSGQIRISRLTYWPTRLANTTLQQITQS